MYVFSFGEKLAGPLGHRWQVQSNLCFSPAKVTLGKSLGFSKSQSLFCWENHWEKCADESVLSMIPRDAAQPAACRTEPRSICCHHVVLGIHRAGSPGIMALPVGTMPGQTGLEVNVKTLNMKHVPQT